MENPENPGKPGDQTGWSSSRAGWSSESSTHRLGETCPKLDRSRYLLRSTTPHTHKPPTHSKNAGMDSFSSDQKTKENRALHVVYCEAACGLLLALREKKTLHSDVLLQVQQQQRAPDWQWTLVLGVQMARAATLFATTMEAAQWEEVLEEEIGCGGDDLGAEAVAEEVLARVPGWSADPEDSIDPIGRTIDDRFRFSTPFTAMKGAPSSRPAPSSHRRHLRPRSTIARRPGTNDGPSVRSRPRKKKPPFALNFLFEGAGDALRSMSNEDVLWTFTKKNPFGPGRVPISARRKPGAVQEGGRRDQGDGRRDQEGERSWAQVHQGARLRVAYSARPAPHSTGSDTYCVPGLPTQTKPQRISKMRAWIHFPLTRRQKQGIACSLLRGCTRIAAGTRPREKNLRLTLSKNKATLLMVAILLRAILLVRRLTGPSPPAISTRFVRKTVRRSRRTLLRQCLSGTMARDGGSSWSGFGDPSSRSSSYPGNLCGPG